MRPHETILTQDGAREVPTAPDVHGSARSSQLAYPHPSARAAGVGLLVALVALLVVVLTARPAPVPASTTSNFSTLPTGLTDYQGLFTNPLKPNYSDVPRGLLDYQRRSP